MGIDIDSKLLFGIKYSEVPEEKQELVDELTEEGTLCLASPYYDAPRDRCIIGVEIDNVMSLDDAHEKIEWAASKFRELTGISEGCIICSQHVW